MVSNIFRQEELDQESAGYPAQRVDARPSPAAVMETSWVQAALEGNLAAFNHLVAAHQDSLYHWVLSLVKEEALAEDMTQAAFISAYEKLRTFKGGSFRAWLFAIARNRSLDELRRQQRRPLLRLEAPAGEEEATLLELLPDHAPQPEEALLASEQAAMIEDLFERLPDAFQQVLRLIDMEGMDYQEAAQVLALPMGTVKSRLARARRKMHDLLAARAWR